MSAVDNFQSYQTSLNSPAVAGVAVTPSDSTDLVNVSRAIHVTGTSGLIYVTMSNMTTGTSVPIYVAQGGVFPARVSRIWNTNTTASGIVALY